VRHGGFAQEKIGVIAIIGLHIPEIGAENPIPGMHYWKAFASFTSSESGDAAAPMTIRAKLLLFTAIDVKHR
jgi:hypothetical protein